MNEKLWPEAVPLRGYGDGAFRFGEARHEGPLFIMPNGIFSWRPATFDDVRAEDFAPALGCGCDIAFILFGMGETHLPTPHWLMERAVLAGLPVECMTTGAAVRTFNVCLAEGRIPATFLLPVP